MDLRLPGSHTAIVLSFGFHSKRSFCRMCLYSDSGLISAFGSDLFKCYDCNELVSVGSKSFPGAYAVLVCASCCHKMLQMGWLVNSRGLFLSSGGWKTKIGVPVWSGNEGPLPGGRLRCPHTAGRRQGARGLSIRALAHSWSAHPKGPTSGPSHWALGFQHMYRGTHMQTIVCVQ